jgi:hypothetical protein
MLYTLILIISAVAQYFGPWWTMPVVCFALCFWKSETAKGAYGVAFAAIATLWLGYALFLDNATKGVITYKSLLFTATSLIGSIVAGFAGMAGYYCRKAL